jgi:hypothetical protein
MTGEKLTFWSTTKRLGPKQARPESPQWTPSSSSCLAFARAFASPAPANLTQTARRCSSVFLVVFGFLLAALHCSRQTPPPPPPPTGGLPPRWAWESHRRPARRPQPPPVGETPRHPSNPGGTGNPKAEPLYPLTLILNCYNSSKKLK